MTAVDEAARTGETDRVTSASAAPLKLPEYMVKRIREGRAMLFLGAGASLGSRNTLGEDPPLGAALAQKLCDAAAIAYAGDPLPIVASNAKRRLGDAGYWTLLRKQYQHCVSSEAYQSLTRHYWRRIYTTNIDDALEHALRLNDRSCEVLVHVSPVGLPTVREDATQLVKLNGSVDRLEAGLIFTPEEYADHLPSPATWYEECARDFLDYTFIFVGTKLDEPIFHWHVHRLERAAARGKGLSFIICPSFTENQILHFRSVNVEPLAGTVGALAAGLSEALPKRVSAQSVAEAQNPGLSRLLTGGAASELISHRTELDALTVVNRELLASTTPKDSSAVKRFYFGAEPTWRDVIDEIPARLSAVADLSDALSTVPARILVSGPAGSGKTTAMMMAALSHADAHPEGVVLWVAKTGTFPANALKILSQDLGAKLTVFVDDYVTSTNALRDLLSDPAMQSSFVVCDRTNVIRRGVVGLPTTREVRITKIRDEDADPILAQLERYGPWQRLGGMTLPQRRAELLGRADKQLLVGLREATSGSGFDRILRDEFKSIVGDYPRAAAALVAVTWSHRLPLSRRTFEAAATYMTGAAPPAAYDEGIEDIVMGRGDFLTFRHSLIADYLVSSVIARRDVFSAISALVMALARHSAPLRQYAPSPDSRLFSALLNHEYLWRLFRQQREQVVELYRSHEQHFKADALFWLQYALFEQRCGPDLLEDSMNHVRVALDLWPSSHQINNAFANIHFDAALRSKNAESALAIMEDASAILEEQCKDPTTEAYALVGLSTGRLKVLKRWFPTRVKTEWKDLRRRLVDAGQRYPTNAEIRRTLRYIPLFVLATPKVPATAERAPEPRRPKGRRRRRR